jgi:hypothetical protein
MGRLAAVLDRVDQRLGMLDAHAHGEAFSFQAEAGAAEHLVDVAGGVAGGQDDGAGVDRVAGSGVNAGDGAVPDQQPVRARLEADLAAGAEDGAADVGDDPGQLVRADVGVGLEEKSGDAPWKRSSPRALRLSPRFLERV